MLMLTASDVRQLRKTLGLTAGEFGKKLGEFGAPVSDKAVRQWEYGTRHPRFEHLVALNKLLKQAQEKHGLVLAQ